MEFCDQVVPENPLVFGPGGFWLCDHTPEGGILEIDSRIGESGSWELPVTDSDPITLKGKYLGMSSSFRRKHRMEAHKGGAQWVAPGVWCSACRWTEFRIFKEDDDEALPYLLHKTGRSAVPGEVSWHSFEEMLGAEGLIESLTTRRKGSAFLSIPAGRVLTQAIAFDKLLKEAWDKRLVV